MTQPMMFEEYLHLDHKTEASVSGTIAPPDLADAAAMLLKWDAEWRRVDKDLSIADWTDERELVAGRLDKNEYITRCTTRAGLASALKRELEQKAAALYDRMTIEQLQQLLISRK